jgi:hypothetical protein
MARDYKDEYEKFQKDKSAYRAKLNKYNRDQDTYGNNDNLDATHSNGEITGFVDSSTNKGKNEKSRLKGSKRKAFNGGKLNGPSHENGGIPIEVEGGEFVFTVDATDEIGSDKMDAANKNPEDYKIVHKNELAEEGGLIKRDSVNASTLDTLDYINKHGDLPMSDARKRRK